MSLLFFIGRTVGARSYLVLSLPVFGLVTIASFVSLFSVSVYSLNLNWTVLVITAIFASLIFVVLRPGILVTLRSIYYAGIYGAGIAALSAVTQWLGLAGVGFSDGFTIMRASLWIQGVILESPLDGERGLKRGFGISSVQALGDRGEYLVGFMPVIFITAMFCSALIMFKLIQDRTVAGVVAASLLVVMISTEAILRHMFLMNSHSLIWLAFAVIILVILDKKAFDLEPPSLLAVLPVFSSLAFARFDAVWIFAPLLVPIALATYWRSKTSGVAVLLSVLVPLGGWLLIAVDNFPFGGDLGVVAIVVAITAIFLAASAVLQRSWIEFKSLSYIFLWAGAALILSAFLVSDSSKSFDAFIINLILGEGLWGLTIISLLVFAFSTAIANLFIRPDRKNYLVQAILAMGLLSLSLLLLAKLGDSFEVGLAGAPLARPGWGDSINRMLAAYIPFALTFIGHQISKFTKNQIDAQV